MGHPDEPGTPQTAGSAHDRTGSFAAAVFPALVQQCHTDRYYLESGFVKQMLTTVIGFRNFIRVSITPRVRRSAAVAAGQVLKYRYQYRRLHVAGSRLQVRTSAVHGPLLRECRSALVIIKAPESPRDVSTAIRL
ncbi:hypothetical protein Bbelb_122970 [Branchiostoma belcheri]|nr:hypothetical protein Bbelb_122970 [Branchiostoma belcheri]